MGLKTIGSRMGALAVASTLAVTAAPEKAEAGDNLTAAENPAIAAIMEDFRTCVAEAAAVTTPEMIPDPEVRKIGYEAIVENCEGSRDAQLGTLEAQKRIDAADARVDEITDSIIKGAQVELGLDS